MFALLNWIKVCSTTESYWMFHKIRRMRCYEPDSSTRVEQLTNSFHHIKGIRTVFLNNWFTRIVWRERQHWYWATVVKIHHQRAKCRILRFFSLQVLNVLPHHELHHFFHSFISERFEEPFHVCIRFSVSHISCNQNLWHGFWCFSES